MIDTLVRSIGVTPSRLALNESRSTSRLRPNLQGGGSRIARLRVPSLRGT